MIAPSESTSTHTLLGDLLSTNADAFQEAVAPRVASLGSGATLTLDMRAARLVDSVGLNKLVGIIKSTKARGAQVRILTGHASVRRILTFTRIDTHATVIGPEVS
jgi:anti-anti-sigma factor